MKESYAVRPGQFLAALATGVALFAAPGHAGTLENMERERALVVETMLDPELAAAERLGRVETAQPRLVDLERMVLRDDSLVGRNTPAIRRAFDNYDLTFLIHAAAEQNLSLTDIWLEQVGVTTRGLFSARLGRR